MKSTEFLKENYDHNEYHDEAGMMLGNLLSIGRNSLELAKGISQHENVPEWVQEKIAVAKNMIQSVNEYMTSQHEQGIQPMVDPEPNLEECTTSGAVAAVATPLFKGKKKAIKRK